MCQWFIKDSIETLIQETVPTSNSHDFLLWEIAMVHVLMGYPNLNHFTCPDNVKINQHIWNLDQPVKQIRKEYHL